MANNLFKVCLTVWDDSQRKKKAKSFNSAPVTLGVNGYSPLFLDSNLYAYSFYYLCLISMKIRLKEHGDNDDISAKQLNKQISG